jgi:hypothetical protein
MSVWIIIVLLLILSGLAGCAELEVVDTTLAGDTTPDALTSPLSVSQTQHNLAVLAVDFDQPLSYQQLIVQRKSVALLVAVENTGNSTERNVTVRAHLASPEEPAFVLNQAASVASIAPGEIQVVRFSRLGEIPYHPTYHLEVVVDAVDGENDLDDNLKTFDIQVHRQ